MGIWRLKDGDMTTLAHVPGVSIGKGQLDNSKDIILRLLCWHPHTFSMTIAKIPFRRWSRLPCDSREKRNTSLVRLSSSDLAIQPSRKSRKATCPADSSPTISNVVVNGSFQLLPTFRIMLVKVSSRFTGKGHDSFYGRVSARWMDLSGPYTQSLWSWEAIDREELRQLLGEVSVNISMWTLSAMLYLFRIGLAVAITLDLEPVIY